MRRCVIASVGAVLCCVILFAVLQSVTYAARALPGQEADPQTVAVIRGGEFVFRCKSTTTPCATPPSIDCNVTNGVCDKEGAGCVIGPKTPCNGCTGPVNNTCSGE